LVTSTYFVPILSGLGAIELAQEPDGILSDAGQQRLAKRRARERRAVVASTAHGGVVRDSRRGSGDNDRAGRAWEARRSP
jgi:hypothetical protein